MRAKRISKRTFYLRLSGKVPLSAEIGTDQHALLPLGGLEFYKQSLKEGSVTAEVSRKFHPRKENETSQQLEC